MACDNLNNLNQFERFDCESFFRDKELEVVACDPLFEFVDGKPTDRILGSKVSVVIVFDATEYRSFDGRRPKNNRHRMLDVKLEGKVGVDIPEGTKVILVNPSATIWGDRDATGRIRSRNKLSVKAEDISVLSAPQPQGTGDRQVVSRKADKSLNRSMA